MWQIGRDWGDVSKKESKEAVRTALDAGIDFLDTADVYGDGRSEQLIRWVLNEEGIDEDDVGVATKAGRRLDPHTADGYTRENLERFVDRSRENSGWRRSTSCNSTARPTRCTTSPRRSKGWQRSTTNRPCTTLSTTGGEVGRSPRNDRPERRSRNLPYHPCASFTRRYDRTLVREVAQVMSSLSVGKRRRSAN